jgi:hypothetical protein
MKKDSFKKDPNIASEVRRILDLIKKTSPGNAVELRIPPYGAIQCVAGVNHRRGTPANQVEMSGETLLFLIHNPKDWQRLCSNGQILASGTSSDLSEILLIASRVYKS